MEGHLTPDDVDPDSVDEERGVGVGQQVFAVFAAVILILYVTFDPRLHGIIVGWSETSERTGRTFSTGNVVVQFQRDVWKKLQERWRSNQRYEFRACLQGTIQNSTYHVTSLYEPLVRSRSVYHVSSNPCPDDTIVDLHSHPPSHCVASTVDIKHLQDVQRLHPQRLLAVMCGVDRLSVYT